MGFSNGYVANVVANNRPVREINRNDNRVAIIPFDTEYKIRLINKKNTRCKVEVFIDGTDVLFGQKIVLGPNQSIDLERFLSDNNSGSKFKFISKQKAMATGEILDPDNLDNGRIQVKFYEEYNWWNSITLTNASGNLSGSTYYNSAQVGATFTSNQVTLDTCSAKAAPNVSAGVTGEGGVSNQKFTDVADFTTSVCPTTIDIWLSGPLNETASESKLKELAKKSIELGLRPDATPEQRALAMEYLANI